MVDKIFTAISVLIYLLAMGVLVFAFLVIYQVVKIWTPANSGKVRDKNSTPNEVEYFSPLVFSFIDNQSELSWTKFQRKTSLTIFVLLFKACTSLRLSRTFPGGVRLS
jgi:hypothetical protein